MTFQPAMIALSEGATVGFNGTPSLISVIINRLNVSAMPAPVALWVTAIAEDHEPVDRDRHRSSTMKVEVYDPDGGTLYYAQQSVPIEPATELLDSAILQMVGQLPMTITKVGWHRVLVTFQVESEEPVVLQRGFRVHQVEPNPG